MSDPKRIVEGGSDVPAELRELFRGAAKPQALSAEVDAKLSASIGAIAAQPASSVFSVAAWVAGGGVVVTAAVLYFSSSSDPAPQRVEQPVVVTPVHAPSTPVKPAPAPTTEQKPVEIKPSPRHAPRTPAAAPSSNEDVLAGEAKLLNAAHRALAGGDPNKALAIAREHARRYPHGQLASERELILVQALVKLGRESEARARGKQLKKSAPNSIYRERLDAVLPDP